MKIERGYSLLEIKAVDEESRIITGIATTPSTDRAGDIVEPKGAVFKLPIPLLWQHDSRKPIGHVTAAKVTDAGIEITAQIAKSAEAGALKERLDEAWQSIALTLVRGLSIGFKAIESVRIEDTWAYRFTKWEWLELSAVTIPANADASIQSIKSIDKALLAATGKKSVVVVRVDPPAGASAVTKPNVKAQEGNTMKKTIAEQISAFEATRAALAAKLVDIQTKASDEGRTKDVSEKEEFDTTNAEIAAIDAELKDLRDLEKSQATTAKPVVADVSKGVQGGAEIRSGIVVKNQPKLAPGVRFARMAKVKAVARLDGEPAAYVAERMYGADSEVAQLAKGVVVPGGNASGNWAAALTGEEGSAFADFAEFLRPASILGKFGQGGIPGLRRVPFREPLISQTAGGAAYWVGEGKPKPMTAFNFARTTIEPLKIANIAVLTMENIRSSNPNSELIVRDALRDAIVEGQDLAFIDPSNAGSSNVKPASITNGAEAIASTGTDADAIRTDVRAVFAKFIAANNAPTAGVWIMSATNALALSMMVNPLGQKEFPGITMAGGIFEGLPAIVSEYAGTTVALVNASDIYEADEGGVAVDMSQEASLEMKDSALTQDGIAGTGVALVSLWQNNLVGLRAERTLNWMRRRVSAVAYLTGVLWGGAVPAS